ncbi:MAG: hypothetical protein IH614_08845, partial [Desulfuromonadales bacterium]|nr:hypothetical protein [Desulfuromonadales bacterium]
APPPPMVVQDLPAPPKPASMPAAADIGSATPERPLGPLAPGWQSERGRPWQEEVEDLCRRLDSFEASVREVGQNILHRDAPPVRPADSDKDLILNMPKFDHLSEKKGGFISGFRKLFFRLFLS